MKNEFYGIIVWNYASVAITAVCGALFSIIVGYYYPENILGRFNTIYSYYIVLSQFCACGIHMAVTKYAAEITDGGEKKTLLYTALALVTNSAIFVSVICCLIVNFGLKKIIGESWVKSFNTIWIALILFAINKVFLGWLNGCSKMKAYAFFQGIRNVLIAIALCLLSLLRISGELLNLSFLFAEAVLFLLETAYMAASGCIGLEMNKKYAKKMISFGIKILPSNAVLELNTKVDVICMSLLMKNESAVGIYSFAVMFAEGFYQLYMVIRRIINPHITAMYVKNELSGYINQLKIRYCKYLYIFGIAIWTVLCLGFVTVIEIINNSVYIQGFASLAVISLFIIMNSKAIVFGNILAQTGFPSSESKINILITVFNGLLNIVLINAFKMTGAALATGISYCAFSAVQKKCVKNKLKIMI